MVRLISSRVLPSDGIAAIGTSGIMLMICNWSIISMIIFGCGDSGDSGGGGSPRHQRHHHSTAHHAAHHHHRGGGGGC